MPLLGFQKQFAPLVECGKKRQTIRAKRRDCRNPHPGERLYLYTGLRTKSCRKLREEICTSVEEISIDCLMGGICLAGRWLTSTELDAIAVDDGFMGFDEMVKWFDKTHHEHDFNGLLIKW